MRKLKYLVGIFLMLCVGLASCNPDKWLEEGLLQPNSLNDVRLYFDVRLNIGNQDLEIMGDRGWVNPTRVPRNTVLRDFRRVFELPGINTANRSLIRVSTFTPTGQQQYTYQFNVPGAAGLRPNGMDIQFFFDGNFQQLANQRVDLVIHSNPYRTSTNSIVNLIWEWSRHGSYFENYRFPTNNPNNPILLMPEVRLESIARRVNITSSGSGSGGQTHSVNDSQFREVPLQPQCPFTPAPLCPFTPIREGVGLVMIEAVQVDRNVGVLQVFATEATFNSMLSR